MNASPDTLSSYIPRLVRRRIASGTFDDPPSLVDENAVLLLADIKGSTGIVESVAREGVLALETLTSNLNGLFSDFIDVIHAFGGDVLYIAGDAFLCYWAADEPGDLAELTVRAGAAGLAVQRLGRKDGFGHELVFRVGIGAGQLHRAFVGGLEGRWELIVAGEAFAQVVAAEKDATPGRVRLSEQAHRCVGDRFSGERKGSGFELFAEQQAAVKPETADALEGIELSNAQLAPYVPFAVSQRLGTASHSWLTEFRHVAVLMADLHQVRFASEADVVPMHERIRAFQQVVRKYDGSIKVDVDSKGIMLLAVFGLPPMAHEDNAIRAIQAAWDLQKALEDLGAECGIGIALGRALCAPLGNDQRREYMVRGDVINRAARLMHSTAREICCDDATALAARESVVFEAMPSHLLKGLSEAVNVQRPLTMHDGFRRTGRDLIGRNAELTQLEALLRDVMERNRTETVIVEGEPGLGKTSLVQEFGRRASNNGLRVLRANADAIERSSPLHAWRDVFFEMFGLTKATDSFTRRERVQDRMARYPELEPLTPLLSVVLGVEFEDTTATAHLVGDARAARTQTLLTALLEGLMSSGTCVLLAEDAHWFDSQSWDLLVTLANGRMRSCIVIATRPALNSSPDYRTLKSARLMRLSRFGRGEIEELIARRIGVPLVPESLLTDVLRQSGGNPFFSEQIVRAMIDAGVISAEQGVCKLHGRDTYKIPPNVEGMVLSRIDRLPEEQLLLIKMASIAGQVFEAEAILQAMPTGTDQTTAEPAFQALVNTGLIDHFGADAGVQYQFRHVIARDVTYSALSSAQRVNGHRALAQWLERTNAKNDQLLAHHWRAAGEGARALELFEKAGERALRDGSYPEVIAVFDEVEELAEQLSIAPNSERAAIWMQRKGTAYYFLGEMEQSRRLIESAVAILDRRLPSGARQVAAQLSGALAAQIWFRLRTQPVEHDPQRKMILDLVVDCYKILGQLYFLEGESPQVLAYLTLRGLNVGEVAGPSYALACILVNMSFTTALAGLPGASQWYFDRALAMTTTGAQRSAATYVWHIDALRHAQRGDWQAALQSNAKAQVSMAALGDYTLATEASCIQSTLTLCMGDLTAATIATRRAREIAERNENSQFLCWALLDEAEIAWSHDDLPAAEQWLARALEISTDEKDLSSTLDKHRAVANLRLRQGRVTEAVEAADVVCAVITANPPNSYYFLDFYASALQVYVAALTDLAQRGSLLNKLQRELPRLKRFSRTFRNVDSRYWLLTGLVANARNRDPLPALGKARDIAVSREMKFDEARARAAIVEHDPSNAESRDRAIALFDSLGQSVAADALRGGRSIFLDATEQKVAQRTERVAQAG